MNSLGTLHETLDYLLHSLLFVNTNGCWTWATVGIVYVYFADALERRKEDFGALGDRVTFFSRVTFSRSMIDNEVSSLFIYRRIIVRITSIL